MPNAPAIPFSVSLLIEPDGHILTIGSYDKIPVRPLVNGGCVYPQTALPNFNSEAIVDLVGKHLFEQKGIFGFVTLDFVSFKDPKMP
jgi:hypothetical protein